MIEAVLFDYGGVLTDGGKESSTARAVAEFFGIESDKIDIDDLQDSFGRGQMTAEQFIAELNLRYGQTKPISASDYASINNDVYQPNVVVHGIVSKLRDHEIKTGIVSNINELIADRLAEAGGFVGFEPVILSYEVGLRKPEPQIYQLALETLDLPPESILYIDDKPKNLEPAKALGMLTVHAAGEKQLSKVLPALFQRLNDIDIRELD